MLLRGRVRRCLCARQLCALERLDTAELPFARADRRGRARGAPARDAVAWKGGLIAWYVPGALSSRRVLRDPLFGPRPSLRVRSKGLSLGPPSRRFKRP